MKYFLVLVFIGLSSCGGRVVVLSSGARQAIASTSSGDVPPESPAESPATVERAPAAEPRASANVEVEPTEDIPPAVSAPDTSASAEVDAFIDAVEMTSSDVELLDASLDPEVERVSVVIDGPIGSDVTYKLDGSEPVAAGLSFEIDDVSAREHVIEVTVFTPGGASKEFKLEWDEKGTLPVISEAVVVKEEGERKRKRWKRAEFKKHERSPSKKQKKKSKSKSSERKS